jgi:hypothetical protein
MSGTTPVGTWLETNNATQNASAYKGQIDANFAVAQRFAADFAPSPQASPNMTLLLAAGHVFTGTVLTEVAPQTTSSFTAPASAHFRIDRVVLNRVSGAYAVVPGTPVTSGAVPPAIPIGYAPCAQVSFSSSTTSITNNIVTDERDVSLLGEVGNQQVSLASATTTDLGTALTTNVLITGTTTITGFGSSASTESPLYNVTFAASLTLTYNGTGMKLPGGVSIVTSANDSCLALYLGSGNWQVLAYYPASGKSLVTSNVAYSAIAGCVPSGLTGSHTTAAFALSSGQASDSTNTTYLVSAGYSWAASHGNAINGTDAGSSTLTNSTTYHIYLCSGGSGTGTFVSATYPGSGVTFPTGYNTYYRRVGSFNTDVSGSPIPWNTPVEIGGGAVLYWLTTQTLDISVTNLGNSSRTLYTLNVPTGIKVDVKYRTQTPTGSQQVILTSGDETDVAPFASSSMSTAPGWDIANGAGTTSVNTKGDGELTTNTSGQVGARSTTTGVTLYWVTRGWVDWRRN